MSDYDIEQAAEVAAKQFLIAAHLSWTVPADPASQDARVYAGFENRDPADSEGEESSIVKLPCIICSVEGADPVSENFHGNWNATLRVEIVSSADDSTGIEHAERVRSVSRLLYTTTIAHDLSSVIPEFYVTRATPGSRSRTISAGMWRTVLEMRLISAMNLTVTD